MSAVHAEILDKISSMTVLELSDLIKAMEEKFGVSAAAAVSVAAITKPQRYASPRGSVTTATALPRLITISRIALEIISPECV